MDAEWCAVCVSDECRRTLACRVDALPAATHWNGCGCCRDCKKAMSSTKEPLGYVIPHRLHAAPASDPRLKDWMEGDPREWLYSDYPLDFKNCFLDFGVAYCQKFLRRIWVPDGYGVRWLSPRSSGFHEALIMEVMPELMRIHPKVKEGYDDYFQFFRFLGLEALMKRKHMFILDVDEGCHGMATDEEDDSDTDNETSSCTSRTFPFSLGVTTEKGSQLRRRANWDDDLLDSSSGLFRMARESGGWRRRFGHDVRQAISALAKSRRTRVEKKSTAWFQLYEGPGAHLHEWAHTVAFDAYVLDKMEFCVSGPMGGWGHTDDRESRWHDGPEIQALMDELDLSACFINSGNDEIGKWTYAWHYERGTWTTLKTKEAITDYSSKADLCFLVQRGDTQLVGTQDRVCLPNTPAFYMLPRTPEFYPLVRLDTGAFWHAGARIRARCEELFRKSMWSSRALVNQESHAMQRRHACYASLLSGMKLELKMELKRSLSDSFFFHMEASGNVRPARRSRGSVGLGTQASPPMAGLRRGFLLSADRAEKSSRCKTCQRELSNCTCLVCSSTDCSELFKAEEAAERKKQNCSACRKRTGQFVQVRGKCGKCFQVHGCKAAKSECMCTKNKRLARCRNHCGRILAVRDWLEGGKPTSSCLKCPGEEPVTTTCSTDGSEVPFLS